MGDPTVERTRSTAPARVSPHHFEPLRRWFNRGRCRHCFEPKRDHPVKFWATARPLGDKGFNG